MRGLEVGQRERLTTTQTDILTVRVFCRREGKRFGCFVSDLCVGA